VPGRFLEANRVKTEPHVTWVNLISTVVSTSIGSPPIRNGWYFYCLTAAMAARTSAGGPLM
jgi:hypothetical protein